MDFDSYKAAISAIRTEDYSALLNMGRKWKSIKTGATYNVKIAIIGSTSIQLIASVTRAMLTKYNLYADIYEGEYNGIIMDVLDAGSKMYSFTPDYIVLLPDYRDIIERKPLILSSPGEIQQSVESVIGDYLKMFRTIHERLPNCQILMSNFVKPYCDALGNLGSNYCFSQTAFFNQVNYELMKQRPPYVMVLDMEGLSEYIGKRSWFDERSYCLNKSAFSLEYIGCYCDTIARQLGAFAGRARKCLILDLDNTIWGGAVGDLGCDGVTLDPNDAEGEAYQQFQRYLKSLAERGVILAVCSKNDEANAKEPFEKNPFMVLRSTDISSFMANWNDKVSNIKAIANELNIGTDSMVFFDDNPAERELVKEYLPEVMVIDVPDDPALYIRALDRAFAFEWSQITQEDLNRTQSYSGNQERNKLMESCVDYDDYLQKLHMCISFQPIGNETAERFVQLTNKTNQFNVRTQRYTEAEIERMKSDPAYGLFTVSLKDRFSNYGVIACVVLKFMDKTCFIENWAMSCRVLKRTVENYTMYKIAEEAQKRTCTQIKASYFPTRKNGMVSDLYDQLGFSLISDETDGKLYLMNKQQMNTFRKIYYFEEE